MNRRRFVMAGAGLSVFFPGCIGDGSSDGNPENESSESGGASNKADSSAVFQSIGFEGTTLVVEVQEDEEVESVRIVDSEGSQVDQFSFGAGVTRATRDVNQTLNVEWEFIAINSGESIDSITRTFKPELEITEISRQAESEDLTLETFDGNEGDIVYPILGLNRYAVETYKNIEWENRWDSEFANKFTYIAISCENAGSSPLFLVDNPKFIEGTPYTWDDTEEDRTQTQIVIPPGESKSVRSDYPVLGLIVKEDAREADKWVFHRAHIGLNPPAETFIPEDHCTGETKTTTFYFEDDAGNRYEESASIVSSGTLVQLARLSSSGRRKYVCEQVEMELES